MATPTDGILCGLLLLCLCNIIASQSAQHPFTLVDIQKKEYQQMVDSGEHFLVNFENNFSTKVVHELLKNRQGPNNVIEYYFGAEIKHKKGSAGCIRCKELEPEYQLVFNKYVKDPTIKIVKMNDINVVRQLGLIRIPSILFYRHGVPIIYEGSMTGADIIYWVSKNFESFTINLHDEDFEHLTQSSTGSTTGDWLVMFHKPGLPRGAGLNPIWESVAYKLNGNVNVAKVNVDKNPRLVKRFKIDEKDVPVIIFFRHGKQYAYTISQRDSKSLVTFAEIGYKHAQGIDVMVPPSPFDDLTDSIALQIKGLLDDSGSATVLLISGLVFTLAVVVILVCLCRGGENGVSMISSSNTKKSV